MNSPEPQSQEERVGDEAPAASTQNTAGGQNTRLSESVRLLREAVEDQVNSTTDCGCTDGAFLAGCRHWRRKLIKVLDLTQTNSCQEPRSSNIWIPTTERLPEVCKPVIGYADQWVDSEYNEMGMRECFRNDDYWLSAAWNNSQDSWDAAMGAPKYWTPLPDAPAGNAGLAAPGVSPKEIKRKLQQIAELYETLIPPGTQEERRQFINWQVKTASRLAREILESAPPARPATTEMEKALGLKEADVSAGGASKAATTLLEEKALSLLSTFDADAWFGRPGDVDCQVADDPDGSSREDFYVLANRLLDMKQRAQDFWSDAQALLSEQAGGSPAVGASLETPPVPPAEPDTGVQQQDLVEEFKRNHHNPIVAQLNQRIRELEEKDAPTDHVSAVLQKALKALRFRLSKSPPWNRWTNGKSRGWYVTNFTHDQMEGNRLACIEQIDKALLSEHRSKEVASGVSASPDSAPSLWIWEPDKGGEDYGWICSNGQRITDLIPREYNFSALHNATLPAPCGSEVRGVATEKDLLRDALSALDGLLQHAGIADQHAEDIDAEDHHAESVGRAMQRKIQQFLSAPSPAPSAPKKEHDLG